MVVLGGGVVSYERGTPAPVSRPVCARVSTSADRSVRTAHVRSQKVSDVIAHDGVSDLLPNTDRTMQLSARLCTLRRGNNLKGFEDLYLKAKGRICP